MRDLDNYNVPAHGLSKEEKEQADKELLKFRQSRLKSYSEQDELLAKLLQLRYKIEDYVSMSKRTNDRKENLYFGSFLSSYIKILDCKQQDFAQEINVHPTKLSRIINNKDEPKQYLFYRLEKHSGHIIPAIIWWKSFIKQKERNIYEDMEKRKHEESLVKKWLDFG